MTNHNTHVLLIEDNPGDADLIRLRLVEGRSDVDVSCVNRLSDALDSLQSQPPSLVLLDLNLPDSRGAETFRRVLSKCPDVPVVVLSGQDDEELAVKAVHQGVQDYLVKGAFDSKQLARAMRYAMERQALLRSLEMSRKQQLEFKNQFLSHVSHELRTPLTSIHQFVTILLDELAGPVTPEQREHLTTILRSAGQLRSMINDLLEATRAESGKVRVEPRCISIGNVIGNAVAMLRASAQEKQLGLEVAVDERIPLVLADPERVLQVLTNLIHNAIKFTPPLGSIIVKACLVEADPDFVYVSVCDTGRGINPEARTLIFERLYQDRLESEGARQGLGLGLFIAKDLVQRQGGRIWVESEPGHGSIFSFTLPLLSLSKLLYPVITNRGEMRQAISLIVVQLFPQATPGVGNWNTIRQACVELLRLCTLPDKDVVLPVLDSAEVETLVVIASADGYGAGILAERIREQLRRYNDLNAVATYQVTSMPVTIPPGEGEAPAQAQVQEIAAGIGQVLINAAQSRLPADEGLNYGSEDPTTSN